MTSTTDSQTPAGTAVGWGAAGLLLLFLLLMGLRPLGGVDLWLHLASGRWMVEHGQWPTVDPFTFTAGGRPWVDHSWGAQLLFFQVYDWLGLWGLRCFRALLLAGIGVALIRLFRPRLAAGPAVLAAATVVLLAIDRVQLRPELFTLLLLPLLYRLLFGREGARPLRPRTLVLACGLVALWCNLHAMGLLAAVLAAAWLWERWWTAPHGRDRWQALLGFGLMGGATLITPWGYKLHQYALTSRGETVRVAEWAPSWAYLAPGHPERWLLGVAPLLMGLVLLVVVLKAGHPRLRAWLGQGRSWLALFGLALALLAGRSLFLLMLPMVWLVEEPFKRTSLRRGLVGAMALAVALQLVWVRGPDIVQVLQRPGRHLKGTYSPVQAAGFLDEASLTGRVYNHYIWGGYLSWTGYPDRPIFWDGRVVTYGTDIIDDGLLLLTPMDKLPRGEQWALAARKQEALDRYQVDILVLRPGMLRTHHPMRREWALVRPALPSENVEVWARWTNRQLRERVIAWYLEQGMAQPGSVEGAEWERAIARYWLMQLRPGRPL